MFGYSIVAAVIAASIAAFTPALAQQALPLRVGTLKQAGLTNAWVAKQTGIYERNGLNVELIEFRNGNEAIAAQRGGQVDVLIAIPGSAMMALETGFDLVLVAQNETAKMQGPDTGSIQVRPDSGIDNLKQLAGKTIAVSGFRSQWTVAVQTLLRRAGVPAGQTQFTEAPFSAMPQLLRNKQIDAAAVLDPFGTQMRNSGIGKVLSWGYIESIPGQPIGCWYARAGFVQSNREAINRFVKSIHAATDYMNADDDRARKNVAAYTGLDPAAIEGMPLNRLSYKVEPALWQKVADMMHENGELRTAHKAEEYMSEFVKPFMAP